MFRSIAYRFAKVYWSSLLSRGLGEILIPLIASALPVAYAGWRGHLISADKLCNVQVGGITVVWFVCLKGFLALFISSRKVHEERLADTDLVPRIVLPQGTSTQRPSVSWLPEIILSAGVTTILCMLFIAVTFIPDSCVARNEDPPKSGEQSSQVKSSTAPAARQSQPATDLLAYPWLSFSTRHIASACQRL